MVTLAPNIVAAAHGMAAIAATANSDAEKYSLAYLALYACGYVGEGPLDKFADLNSAVMDTAFVTALSEQIPERVQIAGWTVTGCDDHRVLMERDGIRAFIARNHYTGGVDTVGSLATVEIPAILPGRMPGFVVRQGALSSEGHPQSRIYLNIPAEAAVWVLGSLARQLDLHRIPFEMKVLGHPRSYVRHDAAVVYVISKHADEAVEVIRRAQFEADISLASSVPLFSREIAPGIGFADDPSDQVDDSGGRYVARLSHGQWVSRLFAEAASDTASPYQIALAVTKRIRDAGRDPLRPYLRAGTGR